MLTLPLSSNFVSMTIMDDICSQIMRQKSSNVSISGPTEERTVNTKNLEECTATL